MNVGWKRKSASLVKSCIKDKFNDSKVDNVSIVAAGAGIQMMNVREVVSPELSGGTHSMTRVVVLNLR